MGKILTEVGPVDLGDGKEMPAPGRLTAEGRFLCRIQEGQDIAGVCNGLAAYAGYDVAWVRTIFVLLAIFSGGVFVLVYVGLILVLPWSRPTPTTWRFDRSAPAVGTS